LAWAAFFMVLALSHLSDHHRCGGGKRHAGAHRHIRRRRCRSGNADPVNDPAGAEGFFRTHYTRNRNPFAFRTPSSATAAGVAFLRQSADRCRQPRPFPGLVPHQRQDDGWRDRYGCLDDCDHETAARRLGFTGNGLDFRYTVNTANGGTEAAHVVLDRVEIGSIRVAGVDALVLHDKALTGMLVGMTFLQKLKSYQVADGQMTLAQ
jgi:clan AA aspartic protease (TIGR02281 family)